MSYTNEIDLTVVGVHFHLPGRQRQAREGLASRWTLCHVQ